MLTSASIHKTSQMIAKCALVVAALVVQTGCSAATQLSQSDLRDVDKLLQQRSTSSKAQQLEARKLLKQASEAEKQKRWDLAAKYYIDSLIRYPTFSGLVALGQATAWSDRRRETPAESLAAHYSAFKSAAVSFKTALLLAEKVAGEASAEQLSSVRAQVACIESYDGGPQANCEPVASVIKRYAPSKR